MYKKVNQIFFLVLISNIFTSTSPVHARIICWTNNEGVRECGDKIPPEFSQKGREEISKGGMVIDEKSRAMTEDEIIEHKRQVAIENEKLRQEEERARLDQILLYTYTNTEDIELTRNGKIHLLETSIGLAGKRNEKIRSELDKREQQAATFERDGKNLPESLLEDITSLRRQIKENEEYIEDKKLEIEQVTIEYADAIARFKYLKGGKEELAQETDSLENESINEDEEVDQEVETLDEDEELAEGVESLEESME